MPKKDWINKDSDNLFRAILKIKNLAEARKFFRDLLTVEEISEFSARYIGVVFLCYNSQYTLISPSISVSVIQYNDEKPTSHLIY